MINEPPVTTCNKCIYLIEAKDSRGIWYDYTCRASPEPTAYDPVTGKQEPVRYKHVREVNLGNCPLFQTLGAKGVIK